MNNPLDDKDMVILAGLAAVGITAAVTPQSVPDIVKMYLSGILGMAVGRRMIGGKTNEAENKPEKNTP